ncbi:hypothetical protein RI129_009539 [Pyrocoelia pectoralis]|uniref:Cyclic nucleotide-binding domain-containing protein n=1 Tax=Pyrocoelia pectoralis TaxID=417401 RepID=A0AAN7V4U9_9COLE
MFNALYNILLIGYGIFELNDRLGNILFVLTFLTLGVILTMFISGEQIVLLFYDTNKKLLIEIAEALHMLNTNLSVSNKYERLMQQLQEFIHYKHLPDHIKQRILLHYEFKFEKNYYKEHDILDSLSDNLRQEIILQICQSLVEKVEYFHNLPTELLLRIVECMKSEIFLSGDVIVKAGVVGDGMYFIASGTTAVYKHDGKEVGSL